MASIASIPVTATVLVLAAALCHPVFASSSDEAQLGASTAEQVATSTIDPKCPKPVRKRKPNSAQPFEQLPVPSASVPVCPVCPVAVPQVQCPSIQPPPLEVSGFWNRYGKDTIFMLLGVLLGAILGSIVSLYGTIVFERYKRFREVLLDVSLARQLNSAYPQIPEILN